MDDNLKILMQELGNAINESLSESERIAEAIGEIRQAGFDVFMVLEATIGFNRRSNDSDPDEEKDNNITSQSLDGQGNVKFSSQDQRFLKALKINADE
jgi:hypothetical protein